MKKDLLLLLGILFFSGCAYNSRNLVEVSGNGLDFSWGLISIKDVDRVLILRETNMGNGEAKYNLPGISDYMCPAPEQFTNATNIERVE